VDGKRAVLMTIQKTVGVDAEHHRDDQGAAAVSARAAPGRREHRATGDQSVFVKAAVTGVATEALIAAALTALMILLFLGSWRSTLIITISIPLSIIASILALDALDETINLMTLGGLALAVGILVDDATVTIENINRFLEEGMGVEEAIIEGSRQIVVAGVRVDAVDLHRVRADVPADWRCALPVRADGRGGGVRDARLVHPVAHARAHARQVLAPAARTAGRVARQCAAALPAALRSALRGVPRALPLDACRCDPAPTRVPARVPAGGTRARSR
jgi:hypothetical protein